MNRLLLALALWLLPMGVVAQGVGSVTLLEGPLRVIRGTSVLKGVEGMHVRQGDILESSDTGFAQVEFDGGAVIALGSASHVYIRRHSGGKGGSKEPAELVLLSGWLKGESGATAGSYRYETPELVATTANGTVLIHAYESACDVFVESGAASVGETSPEGGVRAPAAAKAGQFFSRHTGKGATTATRPTPAFIDAMPHSFRDTLPSRLARFAGKTIEPKVDHQASYPEVEPYLKMAPAWRRGMAERFEPRLKDAEFRKQLEAHLANQPEWDKILHPEKEPQEPAAKPDPESHPNQ